MNINKTNSNPSFNGYVDKSVYAYFQRHQKNLLKNTKLQLEKGNPDCTKNYLDEIDLINHLIPKIKSAVTDLHPSTSIAVINKEYFIMKNDKTKTTTDLRLISEHLGAKTKSILIKDMLKKITEQKKEIDLKLFDEMLENMSNNIKVKSPFRFIKNLINIHKANKLAPEFGLKPIYAEVFIDLYAKQKRKEKVCKNILNELKNIDIKKG